MSCDGANILGCTHPRLQGVAVPVRGSGDIPRVLHAVQKEGLGSFRSSTRRAFAERSVLIGGRQGLGVRWRGSNFFSSSAMVPKETHIRVRACGIARCAPSRPLVQLRSLPCLSFMEGSLRAIYGGASRMAVALTSSISSSTALRVSQTHHFGLA